MPGLEQPDYTLIFEITPDKLSSRLPPGDARLHVGCQFESVGDRVGMSPAENPDWNHRDPAKEPDFYDRKETIAITCKEQQAKAKQGRQDTSGEISVHEQGQAS